MTEIDNEITELEQQLDQLESSLSQTTRVSAAFQQEVSGVQASLNAAEKDAERFSRSLGSNLRGAFGDLVFEGDKLSDVLRNVARSMIETTVNRAITPVTDAVAGVLTTGLQSVFGGLLPFADGAAFSSGRVTPFAKGGVVTAPTMFPMRGGTGLMGEAGPEAILPLSRGDDGRLGVAGKSQAAQVSVTMNISTPDVQSFQKSRGQVAAQMMRAIQSGQKNL